MRSTTDLDGPLSQGRPARRTRGHGSGRGVVLVAAGGLAASALAAVPASATIVNVEPGHNVTVFHNIDFVAVSGWGDGEEITITVERRGALIGTATGPASDPELTGSSGLEVNHGPEGAPVAGDCWEGHTPDIRPGDRISVTNNVVTDTVVVDNIAFTGRPREMRDGDIVVPFVAKRANGRAVPIRLIDSAEFRAAANNQVRFEGAAVRVQRRQGAGPGQYQMRYNSPFRPSRNDDENPFNQRQLRRALLGDGHAIGFGHVDPLPLEGMLHDGLDDLPGPAPGCEAAPSAQWKVTRLAPQAINRNTIDNGLTVRGLARDVDSVRVALTDRDPATAGAPVRAATLSRPAGQQAWRAEFGVRQVRQLDGRIRVTATFDLGGQTFTDRQTILKDLTPPNRPRSSLASGSYNEPKRVALRARAPEIRYTIGDGSQRGPTARRGTVYQRRVRITASQVLKAVAIDRAGNVSRVARFRYRIG